MNVVMPDDVQVLLRNISSGFQESLSDVLLTTLLVGLFVGGLLFYYLRQQRLEREALRELNESRYETLIRSLDLPVGAVSLLQRLTHYLKDPAKPAVLLENEGSFNACLRRLLERESASPALVAALRMKLGFRADNPEKRPLTSGDITENSFVVIEPVAEAGRAGERIPGRVASVGPDSIVLELQHPRGESSGGASERAGSVAEGREEGGAPGRVDEVAGGLGSPGEIKKGEHLILYFYNFAGLYKFTTRVLAITGGLVRVAHSGSIRSVQRRRYYRRKLSGAAYIRYAAGGERFHKTQLHDLGGGGARLTNPHNLFALGDKVEIALGPGLQRWVRVIGEVVRVGRDDALSIRFEHLRESTRDLILRSLFRRYNAFVREHNGQAPT